jgi:hypothetical protein
MAAIHDVHARELVTVKLRVRGFKALCLRLRLAACLLRLTAFVAGAPLGVIQVGPRESA